MIVYLSMIETDEDKSKFEKIYERYKNLMFYTAMQILNHRQDAEDAVHQAFVSIIDNIDKISEPDCPKITPLLAFSLQSAERGRLYEKIDEMDYSLYSDSYDNFD